MVLGGGDFGRWLRLDEIMRVKLSWMGLVPLKESEEGTSLMAQWLRICLPMQRTWVRALVQEDPTCHGATKSVCYNYWACALEPANHNYWAHEPQLLSPRATTTEACMPRARAPQQEKPLQWEVSAPQWRVAPRSPQLERARTQQRRPNTAKNK